MIPASPTRRRGCHWGHIDGPRHHGRATRTRVWICEYPYRTIRLSGPDPDCEGCRQYLAQAALQRLLQAPAPAVTH
jgi:hypothetical protein